MPWTSKPCAPTSSWTGFCNDGVFFAANALYGITFHERADLAGYHPDVRVWEVKNADGTDLGLFLGDYYTRDSKRGGAWMNSLVEQSGLLNTRPVVINNLNISKPPAGEPTLLTLDELRTTFHEFGHALHGLFSAVTYPRFSGTNVPRDFVEYPSQVNEMWIMWPEVLANYARHHATGEPLPQETVDKLNAAQLWGEGFGTTEYLGAALLDLAWHVLDGTDIPDDAVEFEAKALAAAGVAHSLIPPRYRTGYFQHIFAGAGTPPATTPTSGARSWTPTPWNGSRKTAASAAPTATSSGPNCFPAATAGTRWSHSAPSAAGTRISGRC